MCSRPLFVFVTLWLSALSSPLGAHLRTAAAESTTDAATNAYLFKHRGSLPETGKNYRDKEKVSSPCPYTETWKKLSPCWKTCGDPSSSTIFARNFPATSIRKLRKLKTASDPSLDRTLLVTSLGDPPNDCVLLLRIQPCPNYLPCPAAVQPGAVLVARFRRNVKRRGRNRERKFESRRIDYQEQEQPEEAAPETSDVVQITEDTSTAVAEGTPAADLETPAAAAETPAAVAEETPAAVAEETMAAPVQTRATRKPVVLTGDDDSFRGMLSAGTGSWHVTQIIYIISGILLFIVIVIAGGIVLVVVRRRKRRRLEGSALSRSRAGGTSRQTGYSTSRQTAVSSRQAKAAASNQTAAASTIKAAQSNVSPKS